VLDRRWTTARRNGTTPARLSRDVPDCLQDAQAMCLPRTMPRRARGPMKRADEGRAALAGRRARPRTRTSSGLPSACQCRLHELGGAFRSEPVAASLQISREYLIGPEGLDAGEAKTSELAGECRGAQRTSARALRWPPHMPPSWPVPPAWARATRRAEPRTRRRSRSPGPTKPRKRACPSPSGVSGTL
jgi:hypothetical protein